MLTITITDSLAPIARITIHNDGTGTPKRGNYDVTFQFGAGGVLSRVFTRARVEGHKRDEGWLPLVLSALAKITPEVLGG